MNFVMSTSSEPSVDDGWIDGLWSFEKQISFKLPDHFNILQAEMSAFNKTV